MSPTIAIIGSGPTGIYTAHYLLSLGVPMTITMYESKAEAGKGTPYHQYWNDKEMLSNIASIELPAVSQTLVEWLECCTDYKLERMGISRAQIDDRTFYPRVLLGEYYQAQLRYLVEKAALNGSVFTVLTQMQVLDVAVHSHTIQLSVRAYEDAVHEAMFDYVVMATGHVWPEETEIRPGYFTSPWPAAALQKIKDCQVGIRGSSLSAIDAVVAVSTNKGAFVRNAQGVLEYESEPGTEGFSMTMMSRKGLLPEADFYYPLPYLPLTICTKEAIESLIERHSRLDLLDRVFALFKEELFLADPDYARSIGLETVSLEGFCDAYFQTREAHDPFVWAEENLREAKANEADKVTVPWRYAILRMHETIKYAVPKLDAEDHKRFCTYFKPIFVDDYATVPHESIERMLALHRVGKLSILRLGGDYTLDTEPVEGGATLIHDGQTRHFDAFIEAIGQPTLTAREFPFPTLWKQGIIKNATAPHLTYSSVGQLLKQKVEIGGIALDEDYHPVCDIANAERLYCLSLPFMLSQFPFAQGVTSSHEMGRDVADAIGRHIAETTQVNRPAIPVTLMQSLTMGGPS